MSRPKPPPARSPGALNGEDEGTDPSVQTFEAPAPGRRWATLRRLFSPSGKALRQRVPFPWGLVWLLLGYVLLVTGWMAYRYWTSPEYQAAVAYQEAKTILGEDGGRSLPMPELERAFQRMLDAALLMPSVRTIHEEVESLRWRYDERGKKVPPAFIHAAEEASRRYRKIVEAREPILAVGLRDRGWEYETLSKGPKRVVLWAVIFGVLGLIVASYFWWTRVEAMLEQHEENVQAAERDLEERGSFREGLAERPSRSQRPPERKD